MNSLISSATSRWCFVNNVKIIIGTKSTFSNNRATSSIMAMVRKCDTDSAIFENQARYLTTTKSCLSKDNNDKETTKILDHGVKEESKPQIYRLNMFSKDMDFKKLFKDLYSLYGPLFIVCHLSIGLCSLGFFSALAYSSIDLSFILNSPKILSLLGETGRSITENSGKFIIAYAVHKVILPMRVIGAVGLTKYLAPKIKWPRKTTTPPPPPSPPTNNIA